jgi:uncharacterized protein
MKAQHLSAGYDLAPESTPMAHPPAADPTTTGYADVDAGLLAALARRLGTAQARQRLEVEADQNTHAFGTGIGYFHLENLYTAPWLIRTCLRMTGLYERARRNAADIRVIEQGIALAGLPASFEGFRVLQISDPHVDMCPAILDALIARVRPLGYDACVLTGDYRAATAGPVDTALEGMRELCAHLRRPCYGVLGNHDSIRMVPALEAMGVQMLLNESIAIERDGATIHLAGIDDAHYYRVDDIALAAQGIPDDATAILLSHTPEVYRQAHEAGFDLMLSGHTHGGQLCLPGGYPVILDARIPRRLGRGHWRYRDMVGYTSVGAGASIADVRLNCPPEVTVHVLHSTA